MNKNKTDTNFDRYSLRMKTNIYGSLKGKIRLEILLNDLNRFLKPGAPLRIFDAGCGAGQCSSVLARDGGHHITLCDISSNMLNEAKYNFQKEGLQNADFIQTSIQDHAINNQNRYDLILCHAVLEWSEDSFGLLKQMTNMLKSEGYLSLMFFNLNGTIFKTILRGNYFRPDEDFKFGQSKSLTPINPLKPEMVYEWIRGLNLEVLDKSGIRIFYDHMDKTSRVRLTEEEIISNECSFSKSEPFLSMARYIHLICRKK